MWKYIKKNWKKEKGFTLVELLAVIVILGIIVAIAVPAVGSIIDSSEKDAHEANVELFINAAKMADMDEEYDIESGISLGDLLDGGYLEEIPTNPTDGIEYSGSVTKSDDGYTYNSGSAQATNPDDNNG
ncbi:competence type IV pilus major pilin ComGC [Virgibacillus xinjiangensis]|uniref:Competence type IV pilus major pilin ComGC n=1 Tax=Virgibacillus xinjiangensis TaxID=393090 RepID=A0ABV7CVJ5_9BACI